MTFSSKSLEDALELLGELLTERNAEVEVVAIGGGSMLLLGLIERATKDLDIVAVVSAGQYVCAKPLPEVLRSAARDVAAATGLREDWLNGDPTGLLDFGLPEGFGERVITRRFGGLVVHLAGRKDQIFFKLYASVDQGPHSKHAVDLAKLAPSRSELVEAGAWCRTPDPSEGFAQQLGLALRAFGGNGQR